MTGYHRQPEKTREAEWFDATGKRFIRTGDVGRFDADGFLTAVRPQEGHDHQRRLQHLPERPRGRAARAMRRWPMWPWSAYRRSNGARRRWPSWCAARATPPSEDGAAAMDQRPARQDAAPGAAGASSTSCRAVRSARCSSANCVNVTTADAQQPERRSRIAPDEIPARSVAVLLGAVVRHVRRAGRGDADAVPQQCGGAGGGGAHGHRAVVPGHRRALCQVGHRARPRTTPGRPAASAAAAGADRGAARRRRRVAGQRRPAGLRLPHLRRQRRESATCLPPSSR